MISLKEKTKMERLVEIYGVYIYRVCLKILKDPSDAEDAAQNTYIKLLNYIDKLDEIESKAVKVYVYKTAESVSKNMLKKVSGKEAVLESEELTIAIETRSAAEAISVQYAENNCIDRLIEYAGALSESEFELLKYHADTGDTLLETAEHFGIKYDKCRKQMERIRKKIRKHSFQSREKQESDKNKFRGTQRFVYKDHL